MYLRNLRRAFLLTTAITALSFSSTKLTYAQDSAVSLDTIEVTTNLDTISDTTTKTDDKIIDTLAGTSVVTKQELDQFQPGDVAEMLVAIPGVTVQQDSDDPGSSINIRGLQDFGRVNVMIDGARQNFQRTGHNANGQFYLEPEMIKQVDIVRGPVSTIYGSGAIGGVVNFETLDPSDFIRQGESWAASVKAQYNTNDDGKLVSAIAAVKPTEMFSLITNFVWRDNGNYEDGNGNTIPNSDEEMVSALVKGVFDFAPGNQLKLSYIEKNDEYTTGSRADADQQDTETKDRTIAGKWSYNPAANDLIDLTLNAYYTTTELSQARLEDLTKDIVTFPPFGPPSFSTVVVTPSGSERTFEIETIGFDAFNSSRFAFNNVNHTLTYGGDFFQDDVTTNDPLGSGGLFTPTGERTSFGFFVQDKLEYSDWLQFIAAMRYDHYELDGNGHNVKDEKFSPKLTVGITPFTGVQFYATYAEGFRAPAISETLQSGIHPVPPTFTILPNPNLRPETAENYEAGVNLSFNNIFTDKDVFRGKAAIFRNDVDNYIESQLVGLNPATCFNPFDGTGCGETQYLNLSEARLEGAEFEGTYDNGDMFLSLGYSHVRGTDLSSGQPLKSIYPDKVVTTVGFRFLEDKLILGGRWTYAASQDRVPDAANPSDPTPDETPTADYNLVDLFATYKVNDNFSTALNLNNIFDEDYRIHRHEDNEPGFSARLSATIRFGG